MLTKEIVSSIAAICTTVAFLPQAYKIHKTHETRELSFKMYIIFVIGLIMWFIFGFMINSKQIIVANFITGILAMYILIIITKNKYFSTNKSSEYSQVS